MSGWDWLHAGLEVATYAKARKAQQDLERIKTAAEVAEARRILLEAMRAFVFDISRDIRLAEEKLEEFPQQVYIVARLLEWRFNNSGLSPDVFPDFQDKEYVFQTQKKINETVEKSRGNLTAEQVQQSETAVQYITEMPMLQLAIADSSAREALQATEKQWGELSAQHGKRNLLIWLGSGGMVLFAVLGLPMIVGGIVGLVMVGGLRGTINGLVMLSIGLMILAVSIAFIVFGGKSKPGYASLKAKRVSWHKQLASKEDRQQIVSTFGDLTSKQLQEIYEERSAFLAPLLGGDFQQYLSA